MTTKRGNSAPYRGFKPRRSVKCARCRTSIKVKSRGRVPKFCSHTCRQLAYERRKWQRPHVVEALARDLSTVRVRDAIRQEAWALLQQMGLADKLAPPPKPPEPAKTREPVLRLVKGKPDDPSATE